MKSSVNFPVYSGCLDEYGSFAALGESLHALGLDGLELIWGEEGYAGEAPPRALCVGYHLLFWPDWLDFWRGDRAALDRKFGSEAVWTAFFGGDTREALLRQYRADMNRAARLGAEYVVFHVSDVSIEEGYTYRWLHSDEAVIDAACALLNELTDGADWPFSILLENQWWPGFTFTKPALTKRLLDGVHVRDKGLLLDTGHLLNCNAALRTEAEGVDYLHRMLDAHGELCRYIRGMHLHKSLSGAYVQAHTGFLPPLPEDYMERYRVNYGHILQIDRHQPWTEPRIAELLRRLSPAWLTHELSAGSRAEREQRLGVQTQTLRQGGFIQ